MGRWKNLGGSVYKMCPRTGFIRWADEASPPADDARPIGRYFSFLFLFSQMFFFSSAAGVLTSESAFQTVFF